MDTNWIKLDYAIHPGVVLNDYLLDMNMSQVELSKKVGINKIIINEIIKGKRPITAKTAIKLESAFSFPARFWCNLQMIYDEVVERIKMKQQSFSCEIKTNIGRIEMGNISKQNSLSVHTELKISKSSVIAA